MYTRNKKRRDDREHCIIRNNIICTVYVPNISCDAKYRNSYDVHGTGNKYKTSFLEERSQLRDAIVMRDNY